MLARTYGLKVLATSRQNLGIPGEHLFAVPPLAVPEEGRLPAADRIAEYDAVQLLVDQASSLQPGFELSAYNRLATARLCARLEGRFALLTGGNLAAGQRQRTLRAVMDWSHSLCSSQERLLWARLSVFTGGFDLEAAEGVCTGGLLARDQILDLLDRLVGQSIVLSDTGDDGVRFRLLETIRQYGREHLAELGEEEALLRRHRDHYLGVARDVAGGW